MAAGGAAGPVEGGFGRGRHGFEPGALGAGRVGEQRREPPLGGQHLM